jgi:toxin ParE1/3/4
MAKLELTEAPDRYLVEIDVYSFRNFGEDRADRYLLGLHERFQKLAERPNLARSADRLRPGYRRFRHMSHVIFFQVIDDGIRIVRVLHQRMDPARHL